MAVERRLVARMLGNVVLAGTVLSLASKPTVCKLVMKSSRFGDFTPYKSAPVNEMSPSEKESNKICRGA